MLRLGMFFSPQSAANLLVATPMHITIVQRDEGIQYGFHGVGQRIVGRIHVGKQRIAAYFWYLP